MLWQSSWIGRMKVEDQEAILDLMAIVGGPQPLVFHTFLQYFIGKII